MSFIYKLFNLKTAAAGVAAYGLYYAKGKYDDDLLRREYCQEARKYGEVPMQLGNKTRKVTVFLNPAASHGGAKKLFEKNAAPVLHLGGLEVNVVRTEYEGQIKEYMKVFEQKHADAILVAGGNVSVIELITGMMRKDDKVFRQKIPIGIIPVGSTNKFAKFFYGPDKSDIRRCLDAAMAVVKGKTEHIDVLKLQDDEGSSTYTLCGLEAGVFRDAGERTSNYWYFGPFKHRWTYIRTTLSQWPPSLKGVIEYVLLTEENAKPKQKMETTTPEKPKQTWSWKNLIFGSKTVKKFHENLKEEEDEYDFEDGDEIVKRDINTFELNINSGYTNKDKTLRGVELELGPEYVDKMDFIKEGTERRKRPDWETGSDTNEKLLVKKVKFTPEIPEGKEFHINLDGEQFEGKTVSVTLLKDRLQIFTEIQPTKENR